MRDKIRNSLELCIIFKLYWLNWLSEWKRKSIADENDIHIEVTYYKLFTFHTQTSNHKKKQFWRKHILHIPTDNF